jgi:hypothetical protein
MNRRGFLGVLAAAAVAPLVPTQAKAVPRPVLTAPQLDPVIGWTVRESDLAHYPYTRVGQTVTVRLPQRFRVT